MYLYINYCHTHTTGYPYLLTEIAEIFAIFDRVLALRLTNTSRLVSTESTQRSRKTSGERMMNIILLQTFSLPQLTRSETKMSGVIETLF